MLQRNLHVLYTCFIRSKQFDGTAHDCSVRPLTLEGLSGCLHEMGMKFSKEELRRFMQFAGTSCVQSEGAEGGGGGPVRCRELLEGGLAVPRPQAKEASETFLNIAEDFFQVKTGLQRLAKMEAAKDKEEIAEAANHIFKFISPRVAPDSQESKVPPPAPP
jgi:hypothetical protein